MELSKGHGKEIGRLQHLIKETPKPGQVTHTQFFKFQSQYHAFEKLSQITMFDLVAPL